MRTTVYIAAVLACLPVVAQEDVVMKAMRDEMDRTVKQLQLENLEKPYYVAFRTIEMENDRVQASFGALQFSNHTKSRSFVVEVRVGDAKQDNTNFFSPALLQSSRTQLPLEDDYKELRRQMWLITDSAYKKAVEDLSKKRAALQNQNNTDETPDFTKEATNTSKVDAPVVAPDRTKWEAQARTLSKLFREMPGVYASNVFFASQNLHVRYLNSEGSSYVRQEPEAVFSASASSQAADGTPVNLFTPRQARTMEGLPSMDELTALVKTLGQRVTALRTAPSIENYNGPVLAEGDAAPQLFRNIFVPNLLGEHRMVMDGGRRGGPAENPFIDKIGARVLPDFLSITDNPLITEWNQHPLMGTSKVDEDGIPTREVKLVEKGMLKTLLVTRSSVRGIEHSSGSRHGGSAAPTNLIITADNGLSAADLRAKFLDLLKQRNKEYGIVVRQMRGGETPVLAYKVFPDGREELLNGMEFAGVTAATFKEILAASKDQNFLVQDFAHNGPPVPADDSSVWTSLAVPSFIFEDVTLRKRRGETPKPPVVPHPYFDSTK